MSLILDALRQSKQQVGPVTNNEGPATMSGTQTENRSFVVLALLVGTIFGAGAGAVALWQWGAPQVNGSDNAVPQLTELPVAGAHRSPAAESTVAAELSDTSAPLSRPRGSASEISQRLRAEPQPTDDVSGGVTEQIASLHQQMWSDAASASEATPTAATAQSIAEAAASELSSQQDQPVPSIAPPVDLAKAMENAAREIGESALSPHPTPLLENLSQQQKDQIPMIVYSEHNFALQGLASVMLNGKRLQSGQRADTVEVIDILRDSVILRVDDVEFRLKALNTWVNL